MSTSHRHFETIGSTNEEAKAWARDESTPALHGAIVSADEQTKGRGRRGRDWVSPKGKGVYLSIVWRPEIAPAQIGQLTIVTALGASRALKEISGLNIETKWPNDLLIKRKKIGGILCEAEIKNGAIEFVVAGVGLNANFEKTDLPERPIFPATSLSMEAGKKISIADLQAACIAFLEAEYSRFKSGGWDSQRAEFLARCAIIGEHVWVRDETQEYSGMATNIDDDGILIIQTATQTRRVLSGDITFHQT